MALKITEVETIFCGRFAFVEVHTNDGITGIGEAVCSSRGVMENTIKLLSSCIVGEDPFDVEKLWRRMFGTVFFFETATIISAIDIALWDIMGKKLGIPLYKLLGGLGRSSVRLYTHLRGAWNSFPDKETGYIYYEPWGKEGLTNEELAQNARELVKEGYTCLKLDPFEPGVDSWPTYRVSEIKRAVSRLAAVREAVGDDVDVIIECHCKFNASTAITIGKMMEQYNVFWFEDPVPCGHLKALVKVADHVNLPVAAGERLFSKFEYKDYLETGVIDVIMPDIGKIGGITEMKKISVLAEAYKVSLAPHNPFGPVAAVASAHIAAAAPSFLILEHEQFLPWAIDPVIEIKDGFMIVPDRPGLGICLNKEEIRKYKKKLDQGEIKSPISWDREKLAPVF